MYELIILVFLAYSSMNGYRMAKIINDIIGPYAKLSSGRLYPLLAKMEQDGLIATSEVAAEPDQPKRRQRTYVITEAGRERFHQVMMDTNSNPGEYQKMWWHKLSGMGNLLPAERLYLIDHFINFCQTHIYHLGEEIEDLRRRAQVEGFMSPERLEATLFSMSYSRADWELNKTWAMEWRRREVARMEGLAPPDTEDPAATNPGLSPHLAP